ncbi:HNH endonuclease signature motif containing protein [Mycolicibacterium tusciae]|uniref:HNH endonuclease signature motif containing protein n=1 Tax=Mycolicibacterium tusciae TaxID=75922 RepID=UPI00024A171B|nr:HNH endonuclease signature motif containing protein [Mycolicibacterium tusciae]
MAVEAVQAAVSALRAAHDELAALPVDLLTKDELVGALDELETLWCQLPAQRHRLLAGLQAEATAKEMGAKSWRQVLAIRWRISTSEAGRRLDEAAVLGPRRTLTGEPLDPVLPCTALAQRRGVINGEHVKIVRETMERIPPAVDTLTRAQIEIDLVGHGIGLGPKELKDKAERTLFLLDQDGPEPDDTERQRRRGVRMGPQGRDKMTPLSGTITPEAAAIYEAIFAKWAAPGMCNPAEENPCVSGTPTQAQIDNDHRTLAQRQHDALVAVGRSVLQSGELGQHNGLATSIIVRTTLQDLESRAGVGVSGGGTVIPIKDVIRMAAHAHHFLAVFDRATGAALNLFRTRRTASPAQRIMLIARDGGCTKPGCTVPAYGSQVHHAARDWADGGHTNVDDLGLACGPDNRMVGPGGWTTRINADNDVEWIPPPQLDTGQARVNDYHRPERLRPPADDEPPAGDASAKEPPAKEPPAGEPLADAQPFEDEWFEDDWLEGPPDYEPYDEELLADDHPHEPGGPEPNAA